MTSSDVRSWPRYSGRHPPHIACMYYGALRSEDPARLPEQDCDLLKGEDAEWKAAGDHEPGDVLCKPVSPELTSSPSVPQSNTTWWPARPWKRAVRRMPPTRRCWRPALPARWPVPCSRRPVFLAVRLVQRACPHELPCVAHPASRFRVSIIPSTRDRDGGRGDGDRVREDHAAHPRCVRTQRSCRSIVSSSVAPPAWKIFAPYGR